MPAEDQNPDFLKRLKLKGLSPKERKAVESAARRAERKGRPINPADSAALIQNYIRRFADILNERPTPERRERALEKIKDLLHEQLLSTALPNDALKDQCQSLDVWMDYLASDDAKYSDARKYWVFRSLLKMGRFDKEERRFTNREGKKTLSPFPPLNREALAIVLNDVEQKENGKTDFAFTARYDIAEPQKRAYRTALGSEDPKEVENFSELYALAIDAFKPIPEELLKITDGAWRSYPRGSDPKSLVASIADYGTGWCLRGEAMARRYLQGDEGHRPNDLHIYYSKDKDGHPVVPRVVMVIDEANQITEVRGVEAHEHLDEYIVGVVGAKLATHPDGQKYEKPLSHLQRLSAIYHKHERHESLNPADITFLYEIDERIEGFGYEEAGRDPRIKKLQDARKDHRQEDMCTLFGCKTPDEIAHKPGDISEHTKAYIGPLQPGIFTLLAQHKIEHIYTSFPEGRIRRESLEIGTLTAKELETKLDEHDAQGNRRFHMSDYARSMLRHRYFTTLKNSESLTLIRLTVRDLGFPNGATTEQILGDPKKGTTGRMQELGLELCPAEVGPHYRLSHTEQPMNEWSYIGMKPITDSDGDPHVFVIARLGNGRWLRDGWAWPGGPWSPAFEFVFCLRKSRKDS
ncbi:hypothetical protein HYW11_02775 [Candidatus Peregrinibacteria bacterium]|nr:hypothetical protein [Candidatus Peregrinibacteria bacterium]